MIPSEQTDVKPTEKAQRMEQLTLTQQEKGKEGFPKEVTSEPGLEGWKWKMVGLKHEEGWSEKQGIGRKVSWEGEELLQDVAG